MPDRQATLSVFDLLCLATRPELDLARIRDRLAAGVDCASLVDHAERHGVRPQLIRCLAALDWQGVPDEQRRALERFQHLHMVRTLGLCHELLRLSSELAAMGIPCFAFKGPALAVSLYGGLADREYVDLDIMVPRAALDRIERRLTAAGYRSVDGDPEFRRAFLSRQGQYTFLREDDGLALDLHWDFKGSHVPFPLTAAAAWNDLQEIGLADGKVQSLSPASLALLLAGHGTKELWNQLKWVSDFAFLVERHPEIDWAEVHRRARGERSGSSVLLAFAIAERLLGLAVPVALARAVAQGGHVRRWAATLADRLRDRPRSAAAPGNLADLGLCDRRVDRWRGLAALAVTPTAGDYRALPLPRALWPAYYATRPLRLAANVFAATIGRRRAP